MTPNSENPSAIRLSALSLHIKQTLDKAYAQLNFWVMADVSNHTFKPQSSYHFFSLVEKDQTTNNIIAGFTAKSWGKGSARIQEFERITGQPFTNNIHVLVNVSVTYHPAYGLQLELNDIDPGFTLGNIEKQRRETLRLLCDRNPDVILQVGEDYDTRNKRIALKPVIQRIAVISSKDSAGLTDFRHTLQHNAFGYVFVVDEYHTHVQGDDRAMAMKQKMIDVFTSGLSYDVLVIIRGGGADTDFLIFDNYHVGLAIARFPVPVITGIGHQKNVTIADMMAHTSTKTPTKAAEFIIGHNRNFEEQLVRIRSALVIRVQQLMQQRVNALTSCTHRITNGSRQLVYDQRDLLQQMTRLVTTNPRLMLSRQELHLTHMMTGLQQATLRFLGNRKSTVEQYARMIAVSRPEKILQMGFAMVRSKGNYVADIRDIGLEEQFEVVMRDGVLTATVNEKNIQDGRENQL